jgi:penicillin-binding protein 1A
MKFERLNVPEWPLPDLVAFNAKVHGIVDPWWQRAWVRRITWLFAGLFALVAAMWIYFASGLPSSQTLLAYQPPLPTNIRDTRISQSACRERRVNWH